MNIITKRAIPRRAVLRGLGASVALPLLDGMVPALSAVAARPVVRFGAVYVPNGMVMQNWTPSATGTEFGLTPILQPLEPYRDQLLVLSGLNCTPPAGSRGGTHSRAATRFLTDVHPGTWNPQAISMDQIAARELGRHTPLASLELGLEGANFAGSCDSGGFSCAFSYTIAWQNSATPLPMEHNPRAVFERLFGDNETTDPAVREARRLEQRSILDSVSADVVRLQDSLGSSDRLKLGAYLDAVRDVERRIQVAEAQGDREVPLMARPMGVPADFSEHAGLMYDLQLLAHQTDRTRVTTFMSGHELSGRTYPEIDVPDAHHPLSHHRGVGASLEKLTKINTYHMKLFASFVEKLSSTPDGDGSLLDHFILMYGAGMSDSNSHSPYNLPILLLGGGAGQLNGGRHVSYADRDRTPLANLHISLLDKLGTPVERIGDSTGRLLGLSDGVSADRLTGI
ncbi:MAG: hypothetical protein CL484_05400 [Acidobacteria bacterium]|nr:hypothetical protein [Acidobacteriota bacterium]|tara:strand:+ start:168 stop:1532 length:1365 start_codon:yes stop_codon:yes gene_type:complete